MNQYQLQLNRVPASSPTSIMWKILQPPAYKPEMEADKVDAKYKRMRLQVFLGIFIGYAGFYIVRKNFSMAIPELLSLIHI